MKNIVLVGMPGCGKSTVGVILAKTLGKSFTDTDLLICAKEGTTLQNIIEEKGLAYFEKVECEIGESITVGDTVIATGGSMILYEKAMEHLKETSTVVYIDVSLDELKRRLVNIKTRGITFAEGETLDDIFAIRTPLYQKYADITVKADEFTIEETVTKLTELLK
ncbi:MAG: shikimate kinase [Ruminococcus sp.]|nr:shikimate kinase [Ruminococcus sp.]MDO4419145.1 shikimate kinase [Ruminococcus sp.]